MTTNAEQSTCHEPRIEQTRRATGYLPIEGEVNVSATSFLTSDYGLIGNLRTSALVSVDGSIDLYCCSEFDSPSVFARLLDKHKGGHFSITPYYDDQSTSHKQHYLPNSNVLLTKFLSHNSVSQIIDFMPRPDPRPPRQKPLLPWIVRRVSMVRGTASFRVEVFPAFNYALDPHITEIVADPDSPKGIKKVIFKSGQMTLDLRAVTKVTDVQAFFEDSFQDHDSKEPVEHPTLTYTLEEKGYLGPGVVADFTLSEGQEISFILREPPNLQQVQEASQIKSRVGSPLPWNQRRPPASRKKPRRQPTQAPKQDFKDKVWMPQPQIGAFKLDLAQDPPQIICQTPSPDLRRIKSTNALSDLPSSRTMCPSDYEGAALFASTPSSFLPFLRNELPSRPSYSALPTLDPRLTADVIDQLQEATLAFWYTWISRMKYKGRWREAVSRSALALKLLTYEPTGAVVASPTFSLPEFIGGPRNWDYRFTWIRDSAFTIYAFIRLGFTDEANAYMAFIEDRMEEAGEGGLQIMYTIHGDRELPEMELWHLEGYRGSRPVRVGNGAADHLQLDIYGELMDAVYLFNKYGAPISWNMWVKVRKLCNHVVKIWDQPDLSIWEVRSKPQNFVYTKVMLWVALSRGLRLADKNSLPCPERDEWLRVRDHIYMEVQEKAWNPRRGIYGQSYENIEVLDSACLIMPLVFFISPVDPRFLSTVNQILLPPERGGLTANNLVFRYNTSLSEDGVGGEEGAFSLTTFWLVEALTRAGQFNPQMLNKAQRIFEEMLGYANHLMLYSEEIDKSGQMLGNFPQAFTHLAMISAAYNLDKVLSGKEPER